MLGRAQGGPACLQGERDQSFDAATRVLRSATCVEGEYQAREVTLTVEQARTLTDAATQLRAEADVACNAWDGAVTRITVSGGPAAPATYQLASSNCSVGQRDSVIASASAEPLFAALIEMLP